MVERCPDMYERRLVDDEKAVMELVRFLDRKCVAILRVELSHIYVMKLVLTEVLQAVAALHIQSQRKLQQLIHLETEH